jgi:transcriptional regulator with XRE-family HTH domain
VHKAHAATAERVVQAITAERKRQGISQESLAVLAGVSDSCIRHLERGRSTPTLITLLKLTEALSLDLATLLKEAQKGKRA